MTMTAPSVLLSDGTPLEDLIDRNRRALAGRVWADPEIFDLELNKVFARAWVPVAHVTELHEPGDFVTRFIGQDSVIVTLDAAGEVHVLLNVCNHRGMKVCRVERGNTNVHTCGYHGWSYGSDGRLRGVPYQKLVYPEGIEKSTHGLRRARVGQFGGLVFATWDEATPPLDEYIGDFAPYLQAMLCRTDSGMEVVGPPQRFTIRANWKIVAEGFYGDVYHVPTVHRSLFDIGMVSPGEEIFYSFKASINGHGLQCPDLEHHGITGDPMDVLAMIPPVGVAPEMLAQLENNLSENQVRLIAKAPPSIAGIFPSTSLVFVGGGAANTHILSLRFFVPISHDRTEMVSFTLVEKDALPEVKDAVEKSTISNFGMAGIFEADDIEIWEMVQSSMRGAIGRKSFGNYQSRGVPETPGKSRFGLSQAGLTFDGPSGDDNSWLFYEKVFEYLEDRAW